MLNTASVAISLRGSARRSKQAFQRRHVAVRIADESGARQQHAVVQACVIQPVGEDRVVASGQRRQDGEVGQVPGGKRQSSRAGTGRHEFGEFPLQRFVRREVPADEMGCAGAHAPARSGVARGGDYGGIVGESEVIVAGERDQFAPGHRHARTLRRFDRLAVAPQSGRPPRIERRVESGDQRSCQGG